MFSLQRKTKIYKRVALTMALVMALEVLVPVPAAYALTGGPSQPEVQGFTPVGTSEMVNTFTGDFSYNIPLLDVGGYPINISYSGGIATDQEASWVGLGWNINPGVINRNMRSLPDDFNGDDIYKEKNRKPNMTYGVTVGAGTEIYGLDFLSINAGLDFNYNNYNGIGFGVSINPTLSINNSSSTKGTVGLGFSASSSGGVDVEPSLGFSAQGETEQGNDYKVGGNIGLSVNSREGMKALTIGASYQQEGKKQRSLGYPLTFVFPTHTPFSDFPLTQLAGTFNSHIGGEVFGLDVNGTLKAYYTEQLYLMNSKTFHGYGYLYSQNYQEDVLQNSLHDFNREKDEPFNKKYSTNLPVTNYTYDVYSVSGQGIGGTYRPYRNDIGVVHDPLTVSLGSGALSLGGEVGLGNALHLGTDITVAVTLNTEGRWHTLSGVDKLLNFRGNDYNHVEYEPVYFKQVGEQTPIDDNYFSTVGRYDAYRQDFKKVAIDYFPVDRLTNGSGGTIDLNDNNVYRPNRQARNQNISFLTAEEADVFALEKQMKSYPFNTHSLTNDGYTGFDNVARISSDKKSHHISEISVLRPDGARYFYGIPAYNTTQKEATFAIQDGSPDCATGLVNYTHDVDNTTGNSKGLDRYFERNTIPAYAHCYLLTGVVSSDYVDLTGNGPSDDDFGSYTKINYSQVQNYQWRVPFGQNKANYNEGFKSIKNNENISDDKASYIYGAKELWYMHSIETRTHVAEFIMENRMDGQGVTNENGGMNMATNAPQMKRLTQIKLYSKRDKIANGANATPIKIVNFEYDYSLCRGIDNSSDPTTGKLTLKRIYFTYGNSFKGKMNAYKFNYEDNAGQSNFNYNLKAYDRWGNYKPNNVDTDCSHIIGSPLTTSEFPYVDQSDKTKADLYAQAWCMTSIELPSGGKIEVDYEADDYAYVQDKPAMQMFKIVGTSKGDNPIDKDHPGNPVNTNPLMEGYSEGNGSYHYLYFQLQDPITVNNPATGSDLTDDQLRDSIENKYIKGMGDMYFKFLVNLQAPGAGAYEYVPGYAGIDQCGAVTDTDDGKIHYGYIKLKEAGIKLNGDGDRVNAISQAAWQFTRLYLPRYAFDQGTPSDSFDEGALKALAGAFTAVKQFLVGFNRSMAQKNYSKEFNKDKSWIRLYNPRGIKLGGGHRVKRIIMNDQWNTLTGQSAYENSTYGQEYDYTTTIDENGKQKVISSGVASYEPMTGADENPFRTPVYMNESLLLAPSNKYYLEEPFGESFFPGAIVGYSKVTVRNLPFKNVMEADVNLGSVNKNATGKVVHEFYTAKDYPTITKRTGIDTRPSEVNSILKLFKIQFFDFMNVSQGYSIELNDMHGKEKAQWVYAEGSDTPISGVEYKYRTQDETIPNINNTSLKLNKLNNEVNVMSKYPDGSGNFIHPKTIGVDVDVVNDMRTSSTISISGGATINMDLFLAAAFPVTVPTVFPSFSAESKFFNTAVMTKVINRYSLLEQTIAHDLGASVSTKNILWDGDTGEVLLTQTTNQFDDPVYNFTYPAHWTYDRMGLSYRNNGLSMLLPYNLDAIPGASNYFTVGDEVMLKQGTVLGGLGGTFIPQIYSVQAVGAQSITLKDRTGKAPTASGPFVIKILRSGRRNMQTTAVGSVTTLSNPMIDVTGDGKYDRLNFDKILNAGAVEYKDFWATFCDCGYNPAADFNPYNVGLRGLWRPTKNWVYLTSRAQSVANGNTNIRRDGIYTSYTPFWVAPAAATGDWTAPNKNQWQFVNEITQFSPFGFEIEDRDALGRYSSALTGYNNSMSVAMGNNAEYRELAFDGFEDYNYGECVNDHFSYRTASPYYSVMPVKSHTGRFSLQVAPNQTAATKKTIK